MSNNSKRPFEVSLHMKETIVKVVIAESSSDAEDLAVTLVKAEIACAGRANEGIEVEAYCVSDYVDGSSLSCVDCHQPLGWLHFGACSKRTIEVGQVLECDCTEDDE